MEKSEKKQPMIRIRGANENNLKSVDLEPEEWIFIDRYLNTLQQKELLLQKLNLQLERFNE